ncbi:MAG: UDP-N-acetylmuramoyl-tripeptide--D-alanyl-D-alanine ligase [Actinomycetia bacterium]|nr:UDP-N-acetylmuramoyl-tripeptide--D-alanyl-D-alanine ligase [Actinomycetes bacterium]
MVHLVSHDPWLPDVLEIALTVGGKLDGPDPDIPITGVSVDSRRVVRGECFVALHDQRDGHDFVADAFACGALTAIVTHRPDDVRPGLPLILVDDPLLALGDLGAAARDRLTDAQVVGVTGSAGKTSTKDLIAAAMSRRYHVHANEKSFNNEFGVPLTLLAAPADTEVVVVEMGERRAGDISYLSRIARPHVGVVTNVGLAHSEFLGGREGAAAVLGELVESLPPSGLAVLDADDAQTPNLRTRTAASVLTAGSRGDRHPDVLVSMVSVDDGLRPTLRIECDWGSGETQLALLGEHQVHNAGLAAAVALAAEVPFVDVLAGLAEAQGAPWRMQLERSTSGLIVINDAYNASPEPMAAALQALARLRLRGRAKRIAVLGEMRELGVETPELHAGIGLRAAELGVDVLVTVGEGGRMIAAGVPRGDGPGRGMEVLPAGDADTVVGILEDRLHPGDAVLVKASRSVGLERVAAALLELEVKE